MPAPDRSHRTATAHEAVAAAGAHSQPASMGRLSQQHQPQPPQHLQRQRCPQARRRLCWRHTANGRAAHSPRPRTPQACSSTDPSRLSTFSLNDARKRAAAAAATKSRANAAARHAPGHTWQAASPVLDLFDRALHISEVQDALESQGTRAALEVSRRWAAGWWQGEREAVLGPVSRCTATPSQTAVQCALWAQGAHAALQVSWGQGIPVSIAPRQTLLPPCPCVGACRS